MGQWFDYLPPAIDLLGGLLYELHTILQAENHTWQTRSVLCLLSLLTTPKPERFHMNTWTAEDWNATFLPRGSDVQLEERSSHCSLLLVDLSVETPHHKFGTASPQPQITHPPVQTTAPSGPPNQHVPTWAPDISALSPTCSCSTCPSTDSIHLGAQVQTLKSSLTPLFLTHIQSILLWITSTVHTISHQILLWPLLAPQLPPLLLPQSVFSTGEPEWTFKTKIQSRHSSAQNFPTAHPLLIPLQPHQSMALGPSHVQIPLPTGLHPQWPCDLLFHLLRRFVHRSL